MNFPGSEKVVRRLAAAEGYLELGLPTYALTELGRVTDAGPFEAIICLLRGEALQAAERYEEAIESLEKAAHLFPSPFDQRAWASLSHCYRETGHADLAETAENNSRTDNHQTGDPGMVVQVVIAPAATGQKTRISGR